MAVPTQQGTPDLDTRLIFVVGLTAVILLIVIVIGIEAGFRFVWNKEVYTKVYGPPDPELVELRNDQHKQISTYQWRDQSQQIVSIPVDVAMQHMLDDQSGQGSQGGQPAGQTQ